MLFYFIVHIIIGFNAANIASIQVRAKEDPEQYPAWIHDTYGTIGVAICIFAALAAPVTTLFQWNLTWVFITIAEIVLGVCLAGVMSMDIRLELAKGAPIISALIMLGIWI